MSAPDQVSSREVALCQGNSQEEALSASACLAGPSVLSVLVELVSLNASGSESECCRERPLRSPCRLPSTLQGLSNLQVVPRHRERSPNVCGSHRGRGGPLCSGLRFHGVSRRARTFHVAPRRQGRCRGIGAVFGLLLRLQPTPLALARPAAPTASPAASPGESSTPARGPRGTPPGDPGGRSRARRPNLPR
jgi:hypothetical protein